MLVDTKTWDEYSKNKSRELRNYITEHYMGFVNYVVNRLIVKKPDGITREDLVQFGLIGLMEAVEKYDHINYTAKFETFASKIINGRIVDEMRKYRVSNGGPTRTTLTKMKRIETAIHAVENRVQRSATIQEIADELEMTIEEYYDLLGDVTLFMPMSLDKMVGVGENLAPVEVIPNESAPQPEKEFLKKERLERLTIEMENLPPREYRIIISYYFDELTMKEIAYQLGVSEGRVSQMHANTIFRLKSRLEGSV